MLLLDSVTNLALSIDDVCALDSARLSNPSAFRKFAEGIHMDKDFLLNDRWQQLPPMNSASAMYDIVMRDMLPTIYDAEWLEAMGGTFSVRITGIGDYTLTAMNRRVLTLTGLPVDAATQAEIIDLEIAPEIMFAFCRGLLLDVADDVLSEDEFEDREISGAELLFNGMPSGGYLASEGNGDFGSGTEAARAGSVGVVTVGGVSAGTLSSSNPAISDSDWFAVSLNAGVTYRIDMRGAESGRGTLLNPLLMGVYDGLGNVVSAGADNSGGGLDAQLLFTPTTSGIYYLSLQGVETSVLFGQGSSSGTYQISVVNNANTAGLLPSTEMGGDFDDGMNAVRFGRIGAVAVNGSAQGTIGVVGDRDWYAVSLAAGTTYRINVRGAASGYGTLSNTALHGIYNAAGNYITGINDYSSGVNGSWVDFKPTQTGTYYIDVAGTNSSTGTYLLSVAANTTGYMTSNELNYDFGNSIAAAGSSVIGTVSANGIAHGNVSFAGDQDWFAISMKAGTTYQINLNGARTSSGTLYSPYVYGIYDTVGDYASGAGSVGVPVSFTATQSKTYYISVSGANSTIGTYELSVIATNGIGGTSAETSNDFGANAQAASAGRVGFVQANGSAQGAIGQSGDQDWFAVALNAGSNYTIEMKGATFGNGTLADTLLQGVYDAGGRLVQGGNDNYSGLDSRISFTATSSGVYYIAASGADSSTGSYELFVNGAAYNGGNSSSVLPTAWANTVELTGDFGADLLSAKAGNVGVVHVDNTASFGSFDSTYDSGDWYAVALNAGVTYKFEVQGLASTSSYGFSPVLFGLSDVDGKQVYSNGSSGSFNYTATTTGTYFVQMGSNVVSTNVGGVAGTYKLSVTSQPINSAAGMVETTTDFGQTMSAAHAGQIGSLYLNSTARGTASFVGDSDWYSIWLNAGSRYSIDLKGAQSGAGTSNDPWLHAIYNFVGKVEHYGNNDVGGTNRESHIDFTPTQSGIYYIAAGASGNNLGSYALSVTGPNGPTSAGEASQAARNAANIGETTYELGQTMGAVNAGTLGAVYVNSSVRGTAGFVGDSDWYAVSLTAGTRYSIDLRGTQSGRGTSSDTWLQGIYDSAGGVADYGNDDYGTSRESHIDFTPTRTGVYYIAAGAYGYSLGSYELSVTDPSAPSTISNPRAFSMLSVANLGPQYQSALCGTNSVSFGADFSLFRSFDVSGCAVNLLPIPYC